MEMETTPTQKKRKLTKKRQGFVKDFVLTGNATEATVRNYNVKNRDVARRVGSELLTFPDIIAEVEKQELTLKVALQKQGVTPEKIALKIDELLENEDPNAVDKGLKHATSIYGVVPEKEKPDGNTTYNFIFTQDVQDEVKKIEQTIKSKLLKGNNPIN